MSIDVVPNRGLRSAILLRKGWREGKKIPKCTLANLSDWPAQQIEALPAVLKEQSVVGPLTEAFQIVRTRPHGHVAAILSILRMLKLEPLLDKL